MLNYAKTPSDTIKKLQCPRCETIWNFDILVLELFIWLITIRSLMICLISKPPKNFLTIRTYKKLECVPYWFSISSTAITDSQWKVKPPVPFQYWPDIHLVHSFVVIILLSLFASLGAIVAAQNHNTHHAGYTHSDGRPACVSEREMNRKWRNNWDPLRYWECDGYRAVSYVCPLEYMYFDDLQICVHWTHWHYTRPYDPLVLSNQ